MVFWLNWLQVGRDKNYIDSMQPPQRVETFLCSSFNLAAAAAAAAASGQEVKNMPDF